MKCEAHISAVLVVYSRFFVAGRSLDFGFWFSQAANSQK
jgi:hypothetical protein